MGPLDILLVLLLLFFLTMNFTIERVYCEAPLSLTDTRFLVKETIEFCKKANPLFGSRPDWMVAATCFSAYGLSIGYIFLLFVTLTGSWARFKVPVSIFWGIKVYAILFYHFVEFTSKTPPTDLVAYFSAEGAYLIALAIVLYKVCTAKPRSGRGKPVKLD